MVLGKLAKFVEDDDGANDSFVSVNSAAWGRFLGKVDADHWELGGMSQEHGSPFDVAQLYAQHARDVIRWHPALV